MPARALRRRTEDEVPSSVWASIADAVFRSNPKKFNDLVGRWDEKKAAALERERAAEEAERALAERAAELDARDEAFALRVARAERVWGEILSTVSNALNARKPFDPGHYKARVEAILGERE